MTNDMQSENVQQVVSTYKRKSACLNEDFKTQVHPALCLLNTRQPCACVGVGHLRIVPTPAGNSRCGDLLSKLNLETASSHRFAGTWRAPLRRVLVIGHARKHPSHRPTVKENDSASMAQQRMDSRRDAKRVLGNSSSCANTGLIIRGNQLKRVRLPLRQPSTAVFFLFLTLRAGVHLTPQGCPIFLWGDCLCFLLFLFVLIRCCTRTC